ncbi:sarcosine oxidase subunit gamma [Paraburkholderia megapolitana]|uniref:Sarcosine oxidase subunit gamma n=1 Tax=Paraburkholderia megapolitana TaxID=420953 RepID=A0A1I3TCB1_9BURK|nr:sarcosine oxidase subunit gamma [Paraburkholderia megapolitana]QDQ81478.1 sarcosine oxidase subunit gamma [Paraburkholderia megapolitana]SFJ67127.1 sarcosine oxidase subunit gamma [Paraburkholderia megapolitana]
MWNETRSNVPGTASAIVQAESPLVGVGDLLKAHQAGAAKKFRLEERPFRDLVNLRGDANDAAFLNAVESVTGCRLPVKPNTVVRGNGYDVLWLGPDEWLVRSQQQQAATLEGKLTAALAGQFAAAVDIGSGYTVLEISGEKVSDVIARGCPLDLHPRVFAPGQCAQSHYFKASIVLIPVADTTYELVVRRSFADYFVRIMLDAAEPLMS